MGILMHFPVQGLSRSELGGGSEIFSHDNKCGADALTYRM